MTTPLGKKLAAMIAADGPIAIADYMALCLADSDHGYYTGRDPLGRAGDFITAPEISQMFGELIGAWLVNAWHAAGAPQPFFLAEAGPGRGTLMADILRAAGADPAFTGALSLHLVEASPVLREKQKAMLAGLPNPVAWHESLADLPDGPLFFVANEFFDALPIHQYVRTDDGWHERVVGLDGQGNLAFGLKSARLDRLAMAAAPGAVVETCPAAEELMAGVAGRIAAFGGAALVIDYGYCGPAFGDTLQAVRNHRYADPLADPGEADLTAHVDFAALALSARNAGAAAHGPIDQGAFLLACGLRERAARLSAGKDAATRDAIAGAAQRLAGPGAMGRLFQLLAVTPVGQTLPPFAPAD